jgi:SAM-dependent methyltransferase
MSKEPVEFDKYWYYINSVQAPDVDAEFFLQVYKDMRKKKPASLREDFCGTFSVCCEWVKLDPKFHAIGIDLDEEPIAWGRKHVLPNLNESQKNRVAVIKANVLDPKLMTTDIVVAQNFSFFLFKARKELKAYFQNVYNTLEQDGLFITDCFGGSACHEPNEEETVFKNYSYFWDQDSFDPITSETVFHIHFKRKGERKREKVFSYDWRLWSIREIRELMEEVGFKKSVVYWEGTTKSGQGDGNFNATEKGEHCDSWISYIVGVK